MHPRYAAIFGIENLELNTHFRSEPVVEDVCEPKAEAPLIPVELSTQLLADLNRAITPLHISNVVKGDTLAWHDGQLSLPTQQLNADTKRALWALMSKHIDNL
ncbi:MULTISPECIES: hypothetical protein [Pseudoalteromonas]|uniref:hypothetical protein n=1 Tax=Pseudoalteromonas TaxID=53246 RepID=UPI000300297B|nr:MULTISPECIES: hypothetical protein [Pseudoalteromonas]MCF6143874.1 hypothetical protein [Pseudoalteromonas mariniglutinosa NCIMB 1770]TMN68196.1 hypothetical protein CWB85_18630 [Pseudoalteromonas sp. S1727]BDF93351.1 hypothetical protein KAN5_01890 [Pseudoalteromonas sp. KAN5]